MATKRASGDPYFSHPVEVAGILTELRLDPASIATALLHDTIEDTDTTYGEIEKLFGREIADLVNGVTKLSQLELTSKARPMLRISANCCSPRPVISAFCWSSLLIGYTICGHCILLNQMKKDAG